MFTMRYKFLLAPLVYFAVLCLLFCGAENGLAKTWHWSSLYFVTFPGSIQTTGTQQHKVYSTQSGLSVYERWPFLVSLKHYADGSVLKYYDPQYNPPSIGFPNPAPYYYTPGPSGSFEVPDQYPDYMLDEINDAYNKLTPSQQAAITGSPICGISTLPDGTTQNWYYFQHRTIGTVNSAGGVFTYGPDGVPEISFPDSTGYASGFKQLPDGSYQEVFYTVNNGQVSEFSSIPTTDFSQLEYNSDTQQYSLSVPDYSAKLDTIISRLPTSSSVNVSPVVNVNPDVTVDTDLTDVETSLLNIGNALSVDNYNAPSVSTNDLSLTTEEQTDISYLREWHTDIPLIGDAVDFGLTTLMGRIPSIGQEFVWMDYTISSSLRTKSRKASFLAGYHIRIDLSAYRDQILACRGWLIIAEALYFILMTYKLVREACKA